MNFKILFLFTLLSFLNLSCQEQDYFKINEYPKIQIINIGQDFINFNIEPNNKNYSIQLLISNKDNFDNTIDTLSNTINYDSLDYDSHKINNNFVVYNGNTSKIKNLIVNKLDILKKYYLALYINKDGKSILHSKFNFSTVVAQPTSQSRNITFADVTDNAMTISFQSGNGEGRLILMRKDSAPEMPIDGIEYNYTTKYGDKSSLVGTNTYAIYKSKIFSDEKFTVTNLTKGKYYVAVFEFNGSEDHISYLNELSGNIRSKNTSIAPPVALPAEIIDVNNFVAKWVKEPDVQYYLLDLAEDEKFSKFVFPYEDVDVGDSNIIEIELPFNLEKKKVYYRVRAFVNGNITGSSNVIQVEKNNTKGK